MLKALRRQSRRWKAPIAGTFAEGPDAAFRVLLSTVLSLRTKDAVTEQASRRLLEAAPAPGALLALRASRIERLIYPVGFYRTKARNLLRIARILLERYGGRVPDDLETLLQLPGVGRKTANLVVTVGYGKPGICVDTHVHRISNRWGLVRTKSPDETEERLRRILPKRYWISYNELLVAFGQNLCLPVSPLCTRCEFFDSCPKVGVHRNR